MRTRTLAVTAVLLVALGGIAVGGLIQDQRTDGGMSVSWVSDTARDVRGNHHAPAVSRIDGNGMVYAPVSGRHGTDDCALVGLDGATGSSRWSDPIPPANCTIHSVADPVVADYDADGDPEVLAATTENVLAVYDPRTGAVEREFELSSYGYTRPVVADLVGDDRPEVVVVDVRGTVFVFRADGSTAWTQQLDSYTWGQPAVDDFDGDGRLEVAVGAGGSGELHLFEHDGTAAWAAPVSFDDSITWMTTGQADGDDAAEIVVATAANGTVAMVDASGDGGAAGSGGTASSSGAADGGDGADGGGAADNDGSTGAIVWARDLGSFAAVHAMADGDGDSTSEVYAVADDGVLSSLDATTGRTEWTTTLTEASVQMMPPPSVGDVDGDGDPELVAVTNDGRVSLVDPRSGEIRSTYEREDLIYTHPTLADTDGDGDVEAFVMYSHGRVVAFDFARE